MLSLNPNITWDIVINNLDIPWNFKMLSYNINITWDIVRKYPDYDWDYSALYANEQLTYKNFFIEKVKNIQLYFKNNIVEELMMYVWHPSRIEKWKFLDNDFIIL